MENKRNRCKETKSRSSVSQVGWGSPISTAPLRSLGSGSLPWGCWCERLTTALRQIHINTYGLKAARLTRASQQQMSQIWMDLNWRQQRGWTFCTNVLATCSQGRRNARHGSIHLERRIFPRRQASLWTDWLRPKAAVRSQAHFSRTSPGYKHQRYYRIRNLLRMGLRTGDKTLLKPI